MISLIWLCARLVTLNQFAIFDIGRCIIDLGNFKPRNIIFVDNKVIFNEVFLHKYHNSIVDFISGVQNVWQQNHSRSTGWRRGGSRRGRSCRPSEGTKGMFVLTSMYMKVRLVMCISKVIWWFHLTLILTSFQTWKFPDFSIPKCVRF